MALSPPPWHGGGPFPEVGRVEDATGWPPAEASLEAQPVPELSPEPSMHEASAQPSMHDAFDPQGRDGTQGSRHQISLVSALGKSQSTIEGSSYDRRTEGDVGCGSTLSVSDSRSAPDKPAAQAEVKTASSCATEPKKTVVYGPLGQRISLASSNREEVVAAISSAFSIPAGEQHLLQESAPGAETDFFRVERKTDPRSLRFTQSSISPTSATGGPFFSS